MAQFSAIMLMLTGSAVCVANEYRWHIHIPDFTEYEQCCLGILNYNVGNTTGDTLNVYG